MAVNISSDQRPRVWRDGGEHLLRSAPTRLARWRQTSPQVSAHALGVMAASSVTKGINWIWNSSVKPYLMNMINMQMVRLKAQYASEDKQQDDT